MKSWICDYNRKEEGETEEEGKVVEGFGNVMKKEVIMSGVWRGVAWHGMMQGEARRGWPCRLPTKFCTGHHFSACKLKRKKKKDTKVELL
jgi:hypothetical protein